MTHDDKKGPSRLDKHYALLGLGPTLPDADLAAERRAMSDAAPLPLRFSLGEREGAALAKKEKPTPRVASTPFFGSKRATWAGAGAVAAAAVAAMLYIQKNHVTPEYQTMGGGLGNPVVYYEQDGLTRPLTAGTELHAGAKVKTEVRANAALTAFLGVVGRDGKLLVDPTWIQGSRMDLKESEIKAFAGSLELDQTDQGETLVVLLCPAGVLSDGASDQAEVTLSMTTRELLPPALKRCSQSRLPLRH